MSFTRPRAISPRFALSALVTGALCIASAPILVRLSELLPTATAFYRVALALPLFGVLILGTRRTQRAQPGPRGRYRWAVLAGLAFAGDLAFWHWSIVYTSVANATLLANFAPVLVTLSAWLWLHERITGGFVVGLALAIGGSVLLVRASLGIDSRHLLGDALGLITAVFYAGYIVAAKVALRSLSMPVVMGVSTLVTCLALLAITLALGESIAPPSWQGWLVLLGLACIAQFAGQGLIALALSRLPASFSSISLLIQPVAAALLAWIVLDEALGGWQALGGAAVLTGILVARHASDSA